MAHAYPGSSIFHPCYGNIDIGRRGADIGYVMMQLKQEPFYYYWQECASLPLSFLGGKYDLEATQRDPERTARNKGIHLVTSVLGFGSRVNAVY